MKFEIKSGKTTALDDFMFSDADLIILAKVFEDYLIEHRTLPQKVISAHLVLSIVSEKEITRVNKRFRHISKPTDVLSFPLWKDSSWKDAPELWSELPLGDIFICPFQVAKYAIDNSATARQETLLDLCHGFLHLLGHDHMEESEKRIMWQEQDKLLTRFFDNERY